VLERAGVTYDKVDAYLRSLGEERKADRRLIGFSPAAIELLEQAASLAKRWNHRLIGSQHLTGALAESADREVIASFAYCSASGRDVTAILMDRMREVGLVG